MTAPSWMPLYVADYLADTAHLNAIEHGAYLLLIMHYWQNGSLPREDAKLARISRMSLKQWKGIKSTISEFFNDDWSHGRIDAELARAKESLSKRSAAGKAAAHARHAKRNADAPANADQSLLPRARVSPSPSPSPISEPSLPVSSTSPREEPSPGGEGMEAVVAVIRAFDAEQLAVFGEQGKRAYPAATDRTFARKWLDAGATLDVLRGAFQAAFQRQKGEGAQPSASLKHLDASVMRAIAEAKRAAAGDIPTFLDRRPKPADPPPGTYLGRPTPLPEGHPARREHAHLTAYLDPKTRGLWAQTWNGIWQNRDEPRDEAEARARIAELEPIIWPDTAGGPKAPAAEPAPVVDRARAAPAEAQDARDGAARYHPSGRVRDGRSRAAAGGNSQSRKQEA